MLDLLPFDSLEADQLKHELKPVRQINLLRNNVHWTRPQPCYNPSYVVLQRERRKESRYGVSSVSFEAGSLELLPLELIYEILIHLHPLDLYHLSRTSSHLRSILSPEECHWLWDTAYANNKTVPPRPPDTDPLQWTRLLFSSLVCQDGSACGGTGLTSLRFEVPVRLCYECYKRNWASKHDHTDDPSGLSEDEQIQNIRLIHDDMPSLGSVGVSKYGGRFSNYPMNLVNNVLYPMDKATEWYSVNLRTAIQQEFKQLTKTKAYFERQLLRCGLDHTDLKFLYVSSPHSLSQKHGLDLRPPMKHPRKTWPQIHREIEPLINRVIEDRMVREESFRQYMIERVYLNVHRTLFERLATSDQDEESWSLSDFFPFTHRRPAVVQRIRAEMDRYEKNQGYQGPPCTDIERSRFFAFASSVAQKYKINLEFNAYSTSITCVWECQSCSDLMGEPYLLFGCQQVADHQDCLGPSIGPFRANLRAQEALLAVVKEIQRHYKDEDIEEKKLNSLGLSFHCLVCKPERKEDKDEILWRNDPEWDQEKGFNWMECALHQAVTEDDPAHSKPRYIHDTRIGLWRLFDD